MTRRRPSTGRRVIDALVAVMVVAFLIAGGYLVLNPGGSSVSGAPAPMPTDTFAPDETTEQNQPSPSSDELAAARVPDPELTEALEIPAHDGAYVALPSLDVFSPTQPTGYHYRTNSTGERQKWLTLPEPPVSAWYEETMPIDAAQGSTIISSHVDYGHGDAAPFGELWRAEKGMPIVVQDDDGDAWLFEVDSKTVYERTALPGSMFSSTGERRLYLVTCSGDVISGEDRAYYENNLVIGATPIGKIVNGTVEPAQQF